MPVVAMTMEVGVRGNEVAAAVAKALGITVVSNDLAERAEMPYGESKMSYERRVIAIGQRDVPKALVEVPRGYRNAGAPPGGPMGPRGMSPLPPPPPGPMGKAKSESLIQPAQWFKK